MQRYFVKTLNQEKSILQIDGEDAHHIIRVMRMKENDEIICVDTDGHSAFCTITEIADGIVSFTILKWIEETAELPVHVTIAQGIPKGDKFELILQKATELGAQEIIPWSAERSVSIWDKRKYEKKKMRFNKILKEASEQSHRNKIPILKDPMTTIELLAESKNYDHVIYAYEEEARSKKHHSFAQIVKTFKQNERILVCIGPEGGLTKSEVEQFFEDNWKSVRLGPRILRTETAALYVLASISYQLEELRCT